MSRKQKQTFFKNIKVIKFCKVCKVMFRPDRGSPESSIGLCYVHRKIFYNEHSKKRYQNFSPEKKKEYIKKNAERYKIWISKNIERRRKIALVSYHRRKHLHKDRKHIRTKILDPVSVAPLSLLPPR